MHLRDEIKQNYQRSEIAKAAEILYGEGLTTDLFNKRYREVIVPRFIEEKIPTRLRVLVYRAAFYYTYDRFKAEFLGEAESATNI